MTNYATNNLGILQSQYSDGTKTVDIVAAQGKDRLAVDAGAIQISAQGSEGAEFQRNTQSSFGANETKDLISEVVASGKKVYIKGFNGSGDRAGATASQYKLINKVGDATEVSKDSFFTENPHQRLYLRALEFSAGDRIIVRVINSAGANANHEVSINGSEVTL